MSYPWVKACVAVFLVAHFIGGVALRSSSNQDIYPFFSWSLFSRIPNPGQAYTIEITRYGDRVYDPALRFSETDFLFSRIMHSPTEYTPRIEQFGRSVRFGKDEEAARWEREVSEMFDGIPFEYRLLHIQRDPVVYWKTGEYEILNHLGTYSNRP